MLCSVPNDEKGELVRIQTVKSYASITEGLVNHGPSAEWKGMGMSIGQDQGVHLSASSM